MTRYLLTLAMFLGLHACTVSVEKGGDDDDAVGDDDDAVGDDDDDDATADTYDTGYYGTYYLEPYVYYIRGSFTIQGNQLVDLETDKGPSPGNVFVIWANSQWNNDYEDYTNYCFVQGELSDNGFPSATMQAQGLVGVDYIDGEIVSSCQYFSFPAKFDPLVAIVEGVAVGAGERDADDQDYVDLIAPDADLEPLLLGGGFYAPYFQDPDLRSAISFGAVIDGNREVVIGGDGYGVPIDVSDINASSPDLPDGTYDVIGLGLLISF